MVSSDDTGIQPVPPSAQPVPPTAVAVDGCTRMPGATVLLFQDVVAWCATSDEDPRGADVTQLLVQGAPFDICTSDQLGTLNLSQYREIVIASHQTSTFYNNLFPGGTISPALAAWVMAGGILTGNLADGGFFARTFIGGLTMVFDLSNDLAIAAPLHPIITGEFGGVNGGQIVDTGPLHDLDDWNASTHGYFTNLPPGTVTILTYDLGGGVPDLSHPVMVQYPFGNGTVIAGMTTIEWMYSGGCGLIPAPQDRKLLSNELGYQANLATASCNTVAYQEICVDADTAIQATATPGEVVVACRSTPTIQPFGMRTCAPSSISCGFTAQVTLCVAVPVSFGATATVTGVRQQCNTPSATTCV